MSRCPSWLSPPMSEKKRSCCRPYASLMARQSGVGPEGSLSEADVNRLIGAFQRYDTDGSGRMEAREIRGCLLSLGVLVDQHEGTEVQSTPLRTASSSASCD